MKLLYVGNDGVELAIDQFFPLVELLDEARAVHGARQLPEEEPFEIINGPCPPSEKWLGEDFCLR
jgi:hypothetical protein